MKLAQEHNLRWPLEESLTDREIDKIIHPDGNTAKKTTDRKMPDFEHVKNELLRNGVNKKLLWAEYLEECRLQGAKPLMYSQFCHYILQDERVRRATMHINRKPGEQIEVDWAGDPAYIIDSETGEQKTWFNKIHGRTLSTRRANEIACAAKQAREYFRNAKQADYSVRSLLTFYGVASLSWAVTLLLNRNNGEKVLTKGHALEVSQWSDVLSGEISDALRNLSKLEVKTCHGLFEDFLKAVKNTTYLHTCSSGVDACIPYPIPDVCKRISLEELLSRTPDLEQDAKDCFSMNCAIVGSLSKGPDGGLVIDCSFDDASSVAECYRNIGYAIKEIDSSRYSFGCSIDLFALKPPYFFHSYIRKTFGCIPQLYIAVPLNCACYYCEMGICYLISYFMGMLSRYFPTHWVSLVNGGGAGDRLWPIINRAQNYVESVFPELIVELIQDTLMDEKKN